MKTQINISNKRRPSVMIIILITLLANLQAYSAPIDSADADYSESLKCRAYSSDTSADFKFTQGKVICGDFHIPANLHGYEPKEISELPRIIQVDFPKSETIIFAKGRRKSEQRRMHFLNEMGKISESGSAKKYTAAEYCLYSDTHKDSSWKLLLYEQFAPLVFKIQAKSYDISIFGSANLDVDIRFSANFIGTIGTCMAINPKKWHKCRINVDEKYNIYERFDTLYSMQKLDTVELSILFGKVFPVKWNLEFKIDYQPHNLSGSYNIKVSGICNEEQLKKIDEYKKHKEKDEKL